MWLPRGESREEHAERRQEEIDVDEAVSGSI
jgi:hypothetical protein